MQPVVRNVIDNCATYNDTHFGWVADLNWAGTTGPNVNDYDKALDIRAGFFLTGQPKFN